MIKTLNISHDLKLPVDAITQSFAGLAKRRVGKTYTFSVMAEEFVAANLPFVALDPTGAWYGLKSSADGKSPGLPVVVIGGVHGDLPLDPEQGSVIADLIVDHPGYYVLDLSSTDSGAAQDRFATAFALRLFERKKRSRDPLHLFVDEADSFVPQRPFPGQQRMLGAFEALVRRGGLYGLGTSLISQRGAIVNKNVLSQCEVLIALQTTGSQDREAIRKWAEGHGTKEQVSELMGTIASLKKGEAWVWSPSWLEVFKRVQIRERHTFNSSATPKVGERQAEPKKMAEVDLAVLKQKLARTIEQAKANDPVTLRKRAADLLADNLRLRGELAKKVQGKVPTPAKAEVKVVEVPLLKESQVKRMEALAQKLRDGAGEAAIAASEISKILSANADLSGVVRRIREPISVARREEPVARKPTYDLASDRRPLSELPVYDHDLVDIDGKSGQARMLEALSRRHPNRLTRAQTATLSGMSPASGTFSTYLSRLVKADLVNLSGSTLGLTAHGEQIGSQWLGRVQSLSDVLAMWQKSLGGSEWRMLNFLLTMHEPHNFINRSTLADALGWSENSGTFSTYLSRLRRNGLIEEEGRNLRASRTLLEDAKILA